MKITREIVISDFDKLKKIALKYLKKRKYREVVETLKIASKLMNSFNFIFTDDELERIILNLSREILKNKNIKKIEKDVVLFYDYFSLDNRGLTEQYLEALIKLEYKIIYITQQNNKDKMKNIIKLLEKAKKTKIFIINAKKNEIEKIMEIREIILTERPECIFNHTAPWDIVGMVALSNISIKRYLINLTDHAFWLGKCCTDYYIEFRSYGRNISLYHRNIPVDKLCMLPYYPIANNEIEFQGFDFETINKKLILSGGSLYKIYGSSKFFEIVKYILDIDQETIFLFLGNGNDTILKNFILKNNLERRFFFFNERKDINEVFKRCYFYLGTYPISGGLMTQLAVINKKIPICYYNGEEMNDVNELFINNENINIVFSDLELLKIEIEKVLFNEEYKMQKEEKLKDLLIAKNIFTAKLKNILRGEKTEIYKEKNYNPNVEKIGDIYLEQENKYLKCYLNIFSTKYLSIKKFFLKYYFLKKINKILKGIKK